MGPLSVLVVDDDQGIRDQVTTLLTQLGITTRQAETGEAALQELATAPPDVVMLDVLMPGVDGMEVLRRYRAGGGHAPVIMCSVNGQPEAVVRAMRAGATDYVTKPFNAEELPDILHEAAHRAGARSQAITTSVLGTSAAMRRVDELLHCIADTDVPVLITGESGVGKDVVARELHSRSSRAEKVFIKINCAALPSELLESELFGHERGSFTGADRTKPGQFELAHGGTLFLDEIGEMPVAMQAKLLQALQDGEFFRVGGQRKIKVDTHVIVATNVDLAKAIARGAFREDLYYRLNVVEVAIPPLRERREDIPHLLDHFIHKYGKRYGRALDDIPPEVIERFLTYDFPGNIRELENLVRRLMVLRDPRYVLSELKDRPTSPMVAPVAGKMDLKQISRRAAHAAERAAIIAMLNMVRGNKREAAERLGISYKAILYKIHDFAIGDPQWSTSPALAQASVTPALPAHAEPTDPDDDPNVI